jgi:hypothetical protein
MHNDPGDCPECQSKGSVEDATCQVCLAEVDEGPWARPTNEDTPSVHGALRFRDVLSELRHIAELSEQAPRTAAAVADACRRAESLLKAIRWQFLDDVVGPDLPGPGSRDTAEPYRKAVILS